MDAAESEAVEGWTDADIAIECLTFLGAGSDTTAVTLTFATYSLAVNPEVQERLANEIHDYFEKNAVSKDIGTCACVRLCVCVHVCVCVYVCVCVHACMHACVCVRTCMLNRCIYLTRQLNQRMQFAMINSMNVRPAQST